MAANRLIIICGLPGVGKTTLAHELAKQIKALVITSEKVIGELFPNIDINEDRDFSEEEVSRGNEEMNKQARKYLIEKKSVIIEGAYRSKKLRLKARNVAKDLDIPVTFIYITCSDKIVRKRLDKRFSSGQQQHGYKAHMSVKESFEPVKHYDYHIDTSTNSSRQIQKIINKV